MQSNIISQKKVFSLFQIFPEYLTVPDTVLEPEIIIVCKKNKAPAFERLINSNK